MLWNKEINKCLWGASKFYGAVAGNDQLNVIQWAHETGADSEWDTDTCTHVAESGHLHVLQYIRQHGGPWDISMCICAAQYGHLNILQ